MEEFNVWLGIFVGIVGLMQLACTGFVLWIIQKSRADFAQFELRMVNRISETLKGYLPSQQFADFLVSNQKEHNEYEETIKQLHNWQYKDIEPAFRMTQSHVEEHTKDLVKHGKRLDELECKPKL